MLRGVVEKVSISSTFYVQLFHQSCGAKKIAKPIVIREQLPNLLSYKKQACKMLMKLTPGKLTCLHNTALQKFNLNCYTLNCAQNLSFLFYGVNTIQQFSLNKILLSKFLSVYFNSAHITCLQKQCLDVFLRVNNDWTTSYNGPLTGLSKSFLQYLSQYFLQYNYPLPHSIT